MSDALLVLNAGSSSLKFSVFLDENPPRLLLRGQLEGLLTQPRFLARNATAVVGEKEWPSGTKLGHQGAIDFLFTWGRQGTLGGHRIVATGHRVVHGGMKFTAPVLIDTETLAALESLVSLAPLHQPHNLAAIKAVAQIAPTLPRVGCFDTAFHRTQPMVAQAFALPRRYAEEGVRRARERKPARYIRVPSSPQAVLCAPLSGVIVATTFPSAPSTTFQMSCSNEGT